MWGASGRGPRGRRRIPAPSPASAVWFGAGGGPGASPGTSPGSVVGSRVEVFLAANSDAAHTGATLPGRVLAFAQCDLGEHEMHARPSTKLHEKKKELESVVFLNERSKSIWSPWTPNYNQSPCASAEYFIF